MSVLIPFPCLTSSHYPTHTADNQWFDRHPYLRSYHFAGQKGGYSAGGQPATCRRTTRISTDFEKISYTINSRLLLKALHGRLWNAPMGTFASFFFARRKKEFFAGAIIPCECRGRDYPTSFATCAACCAHLWEGSEHDESVSTFTRLSTLPWARESTVAWFAADPNWRICHGCFIGRVHQTRRNYMDT
jgi:hypothetical protein